MVSLFCRTTVIIHLNSHALENGIMLSGWRVKRRKTSAGSVLPSLVSNNSFIQLSVTAECILRKPKEIKCHQIRIENASNRIYACRYLDVNSASLALRLGLPSFIPLLRSANVVFQLFFAAMHGLQES